MITKQTAKNNNIKTIDSNKTKALADVVDMTNTTAEKQKINYGKKFFDALQRELPDVDIKYQTKINGQDLSELLEDMR